MHFSRLTVRNAEVIELENTGKQLSELLKKHNSHTMSIESETMTVKLLNSYKHFLKEVDNERVELYLTEFAQSEHEGFVFIALYVYTEFPEKFKDNILNLPQ